MGCKFVEGIPFLPCLTPFEVGIKVCTSLALIIFARQAETMQPHARSLARSSFGACLI